MSSEEIFSKSGKTLREMKKHYEELKKNKSEIRKELPKRKKIMEKYEDSSDDEFTRKREVPSKSKAIYKKRIISEDESDEDEIPKLRKRVSSDDEDEIPKRKKIVEEEIPKRKKKIIPSDDDDEDDEEMEIPKRKKELGKRKRPSSSDDEDEIPKRKKRSSSGDEIEKKKKGKSTNFSLLNDFAQSAFKGQAIVKNLSATVLEDSHKKKILNTLLDYHRNCCDDLIAVQYIKCVLVFSQVWLYKLPFANEGTFEQCLDSINVDFEGKKWDWPEIQVDHVSRSVFNQICEAISLQFNEPKYKVTFQEFLSEEGMENGFESLLPFTDLSNKKGTKLAMSEGVHMGIGISGNFVMVAQNVKRPKFDMTFPVVGTSVLSKSFNGNPPVKVHCGSLKAMVSIGNLEDHILIFGGFAGFEAIESTPGSGVVNLRLRTLMSAKIGSTKSIGTDFLDLLKME